MVVAVVGAVAFGLVGCGDGGPASGPSPTGSAAAPPVRRGPSIATTVDSAVFTVDCRFSHRAPDDPIVHPGRPGASHVHDFFGATEADAHSTAASLRGGPTSCDDRQDTASYWAPTLYDGSEPIRPTFARAYYRAAIGADGREVRALPPGLEMVAGDSHAEPGAWPSLGTVAWGCGLRPRRLHHQPPRTCTPSSPLALRLVFPDCWDGRHVRSRDHRSHLARSRDGRCPASHPVPLVQVQVSITYPVWTARPGAASPQAADLVAASGRWETSHGDLLNGWDQDRLEHQVALCIRVMANCTIG